LKFSKRRRAVPLRPIWTIMVAAKLDQSRVLVTKFHQNLLTLKGRSAGQRQTRTDRQTRVKIRALQECNRATDHATRSVTVDCIYAHSTAIRPDNATVIDRRLFVCCVRLGYFSEGFLAIQRAVDLSIIDELGGMSRAHDVDVELKNFPYRR